MGTSTSTSAGILQPEDLRAGIVPHISVWESFKFGFKGPGPIGLLIGFVLFVFPFIGFVTLNGWLAQTSRRLVNGEHPAVEPFSIEKVSDYLKSGLVVLLPQFVIGVGLVSFLVFSGVGAATVSTAFASIFLEGPELVAAMLLVFTAIMLMVFIYGLATLLVCQMRAELSGDLKVALDFPATFRFVKRNRPILLLPMVSLLLLLIPAMFGGMMFAIVGSNIVLTAAHFMFAHFRAQLYLADVAAGGEELSIFDGPGAVL